MNRLIVGSETASAVATSIRSAEQISSLMWWDSTLPYFVRIHSGNRHIAAPDLPAMKLRDRDFSAWQMFGFALTAITAVLVGGLIIERSELAVGGWAIFWQFTCVIPLGGGMLAYLARRVWLAGRLTRHSIEPEGRILLAPMAVIVLGTLLAYSDWVRDVRFALSRGAFERAVLSGETFESYGSERWIGLYRIRSIQIDALGRTAFNLGDCRMFAHCELEFDATTSCETRGWREYWVVDTHWCVVVHYHF